MTSHAITLPPKTLAALKDGQPFEFTVPITAKSIAPNAAVRTLPGIQRGAPSNIETKAYTFLFSDAELVFGDFRVPVRGQSWKACIRPANPVGATVRVQEAYRLWVEGYSCGIAYADGQETLTYKDGKGKRITLDTNRKLMDMASRVGGDLRYSGARPELRKLAWREPATMPEWASRWQISILECRPIQKAGSPLWYWHVTAKPSVLLDTTRGFRPSRDEEPRMMAPTASAMIEGRRLREGT